ncbi:hypothetical protein F5Y16DRAFT_179074 [Xylariaceae sp. FL0255]|nr:hypothetical protein F5Y16DRAFT_179074 [Xylariaceae sp. FL0255]
MDYTTQFGRLARHIQIIAARDTNSTNCHPADNIDLCEKPATSGNGTAITIGAIGGAIAVVLVVLLTYLHLRKKRMDKKEWPKNNQELDDYGFDVPQSQRARRAAQAQTQPSRPTQQGGMSATNNRESQGSLNDLERSLRGHTTNAFKRHDDDVAIDIKPATPADRI